MTMLYIYSDHQSMEIAMNWKIAQAKKKFSELIHNTQKEPQFIYNRDSVVAAIISPEEYTEFQSFKKEKERQTLADFFQEIQSICREENYIIEVPKRRNREVRFS